MVMSSKSEEIVDRLVKTGRYKSRNDVLDEAIQMMERREQYVDEIWKGIEEGRADAEAGRVYTAEEVEARLGAKFAVKS